MFSSQRRFIATTVTVLALSVLAAGSVCDRVFAAQTPVVGDIVISPDDTPLVNETLSFSIAASSPDNLPLKITWTFGTAANATAAGPSVKYAFGSAGDSVVTAAIDDGVNAAVIKTTHIQVIAAPAATTPVGADSGTSQTNPVDGATCAVVLSAGGVVELAISQGTNTNVAGSLEVPITTDFGDGSRLATGSTPSHAYQKPGIYVAHSTITDKSSGSPIGQIRKTLAIANRDVNLPISAASEPSSHTLTVSKITGKFHLINETRIDALTATFSLEAPPGLITTIAQDLTLSIGNVVETMTLNPRGIGSGAKIYKRVKVVWKTGRGTPAAGKTAAFTVTMAAPNLDSAGFDTEGISPFAEQSPPSIQVAVLLAGVAWSGKVPVTIKVSKKRDSATLHSN